MTRTRQKIVVAEPEPELEFKAARTRSRNWWAGGMVRRGMERNRHWNWWIRSGRGVIFTAPAFSGQSPEEFRGSWKGEKQIQAFPMEIK